MTTARLRTLGLLAILMMLPRLALAQRLGAVTTTPWLQPTQVMDGRFVKFSAQVDF